MISRRALTLTALTLLIATPLAADEVTSFRLGELKAGARFEIKTENRLYRGEVVEKSTGECRIAASVDDATTFSPIRVVYLLGATPGPQAGFTVVRMHEVKTGMKLELGMGNLEKVNRYLTSTVKSIALLEPAAALATAAE